MGANLPSILKRKYIPDKDIVTLSKKPRRSDLGFDLFPASAPLRTSTASAPLANALPTEQQKAQTAENDSKARNAENEAESKEVVPVPQEAQKNPDVAEPGIKASEEKNSTIPLETIVRTNMPPATASNQVAQSLVLSPQANPSLTLPSPGPAPAVITPEPSPGSVTAPILQETPPVQPTTPSTYTPHPAPAVITPEPSPGPVTAPTPQETPPVQPTTPTTQSSLRKSYPGFNFTAFNPDSPVPELVLKKKMTYTGDNNVSRVLNSSATFDDLSKNTTALGKATIPRKILDSVKEVAGVAFSGVANVASQKFIIHLMSTMIGSESGSALFKKTMSSVHNLKEGTRMRGFYAMVVESLFSRNSIIQSILSAPASPLDHDLMNDSYKVYQAAKEAIELTDTMLKGAGYK